jgi:hypothetical protein
MQSAAFDETRKVLVMFGGLGDAGELQDLWEWNPASGTWTQRSPIDLPPKPRGGASMVFDSIHNNFVIFGGRVTFGTLYVDYADVWEWNPTTGAFTDRSNSGQGPGYRSQQSMVFEKSTGKVLLFGGGTPDVNAPDDQWGGVSVAFGDTWEWDPVQGKWSQLQPATAPSARYAAGLVWDNQRSRAVLFGGMEKPLAGLSGVPKQDTWEWDPSKSIWNNRTIAGSRPSARNGHAMAYDPVRGVTVLVGGFDIDTGYALADVWEWDPASGAWSQRFTGSEPNLPTARIYASLVTDSALNRLDLVGGGIYSYDYSYLRDGEIWEFNPATTTFTDRTPLPPHAWPSARFNPAMAFCPITGKTYMFGGMDNGYVFLDELWEWDGSSWSQVESDLRPAARTDTAMAYDPSRKSLIVYGGTGNPPVGGDANVNFGDTWEWNPSTRKWGQLFPKSSPEPRNRHAMVSDSGRAKLLLFGGERPTFDYTYPTPGSPLSLIPSVPQSGSGMARPPPGATAHPCRWWLCRTGATTRRSPSTIAARKWSSSPTPATTPSTATVSSGIGIPSRPAGRFATPATQPTPSTTWVRARSPTIACAAGTSCPSAECMHRAPTAPSKPGNWMPRVQPGTCAP